MTHIPENWQGRFVLIAHYTHYSIPLIPGPPNRYLVLEVFFVYDKETRTETLSYQWLCPYLKSGPPNKCETTFD